MQKLHYEILIDSPVKKVWDTMLEDATYREWTALFHEGSRYEGSWDEGSKILFLGPGEDGQGEGGMVSKIAENRLHEFISIRHYGFIFNGVEDTTSDFVKKWIDEDPRENYTFTNVDGKTQLVIDVDVDEDWADDLAQAWPKALERLKELCEA